MKSILFLFFIGVRSSIKYTPKRIPEKSALNEVFLVFGALLVLVCWKLLLELGLWQWIMDNWPFEYGRANSRNLIAPTGVLGLLVAVSWWTLIKKYFAKDKVVKRIYKAFDTKVGKNLAEKYDSMPIVLMFFNAFAGAMFAGGFWVIFGLCVVVWVAIEFWVIKTFYSK